ncbi:type II toxin-antitoxin system prevent-host-death family antitoxin (plasmid) [Aliirhizobium terrae]|uniref:type II toxin-antitoxin system Phd/YefM family antitoxin n=1 Tax=Terrirhizobium terrae TaxID=2926709 RepID=UPI002575D921|nr:type II toxin-antitoxin system prevent-host-death family antitoxin [Rhizobium sp. CC-CFT758]WJH38406.1 type II toxin-antitoxin system prevent-host-death family antitoxin [Rhizobium sp. CC-CFT758]
MRIFVDVDEAAARFEELIELALRGDEVLICRSGKPVAELTAISKTVSPADELRMLMDEGRATVPPGASSNHHDFYDEHGLPK